VTGNEEPVTDNPILDDSHCITTNIESNLIAIPIIY
jgi:hypothetical protein